MRKTIKESDIERIKRGKGLVQRTQKTNTQAKGKAKEKAVGQSVDKKTTLEVIKFLDILTDAIVKSNAVGNETGRIISSIARGTDQKKLRKAFRMTVNRNRKGLIESIDIVEK